MSLPRTTDGMVPPQGAGGQKLPKNGSRRAYQYGFDPRTVRSGTLNDLTGDAENLRSPGPLTAMVDVDAVRAPFLTTKNRGAATRCAERHCRGVVGITRPMFDQENQGTASQQAATSSYFTSE